ncbi:hypothetical protein [uncultured Ruegeria sp.]|uniref:hypothetical protein n=1 Tax=uncultured Ruegeria sp. TaxID=259304 RepID=UPI00262FB02C|nr:hypothetical protein [uncultured Ruegeria sp.]
MTSVSLPVLAITAGLALSAPSSLHAGPQPGGATEFTQLLNHIELASIVGLEGETLATNAESLSNQIQQLATQIQTYEAILQNLEQIPDTLLDESMAPVQDLYALMTEARAIAASGKDLDKFLRSDLIKDPLFEGKSLSDARLAERYDKWVDTWDGALKTGLGQVGLSLEDIGTEAKLLDRINGQFPGVQGHLQALQVSNELSSSAARQMVDLRALTATQAQQNAVAWGRVLDDLDRKESAQREGEVMIQESIEAYEANDNHRTINEILELGK